MMDPTGLLTKTPVPPRGMEVLGEYAPGVLQMRDLRVKTHADRQLKLYSPCTCGSGKKYKFCCNGVPKFVINTDNL